ncbi:gamma-type small acid-soluble spore protein [Virgibacillus sp. C22-A2]|uniref:Small, acid-soluble spore protein gamma-type n=1 Tax=Virgibacillus tibetensis TaxID=3042313 RepID=A0ABU6KE04_9BACI|nr:gamma-type small acid-soluble spore protein [Virgibacillus sp. C22-A2]
MAENSDSYTIAGTNIEAVKRQAQRSGLTYNQAKEYIAKTTGGHGTHVYSDTDAEEVKRRNQQSINEQSTT